MGPIPRVIFTKRELQVVELVAQGEGNRFIGEKLGISEETCKRHITNIMDKTGHSNRTILAVWWVTNEGKDCVAMDLRAEIAALKAQLKMANRMIAHTKKQGPARWNEP